MEYRVSVRQGEITYLPVLLTRSGYVFFGGVNTSTIIPYA